MLMPSPTNFRVQNLTVFAMFTAAALSLSAFENLIPSPVAGIKLGLANIIILFVLLCFGYKEAMLINISRCLLASVFGGGISSLIYSLTGAIASLSFMYLLILASKGRLSTVCISICGALIHILVQLYVASVITGSMYVFELIPIYMVTSVISGLFVGVACWFLTGFYNKFNKNT